MSESKEEKKTTRQFATFWLSDSLYGVEVEWVQEITRRMAITPVPLSPEFIEGLINLRGQIVTTINLRKLFGLKGEYPDSPMNVVCSSEGLLVALLADETGDVVEVPVQSYEPVPDTVPGELATFLECVFKMDGALLSVIDTKVVVDLLRQSESGSSKGKDHTHV